CLPVGVEVGADHEIVVMGERVDEAAITPGVVGREYAGSDFVECFVQNRRGGDVFGRIDATGARALDLRRGQAEDEDVVVADQIAHLDIGAVESADGQRAVERHLHVASAGGFHAGGRNLLRQVGGGHDSLGQRNVVVRQEHYFQKGAHGRVRIDDLRDVDRELDDQLGLSVAGGRLTGEDLDSGREVDCRVRTDGVIAR